MAHPVRGEVSGTDTPVIGWRLINDQTFLQVPPHPMLNSGCDPVKTLTVHIWS